MPSKKTKQFSNLLSRWPSIRVKWHLFSHNNQEKKIRYRGRLLINNFDCSWAQKSDHLLEIYMGTHGCMQSNIWSGN